MRGFYQYKYQEQELQETGFYSFKWRVIDARELEGLEAVLINDTTIEWRVKVNNNLGSDYSKTLLQDAADVLSQNGLTVKIIEDTKALFTINLQQPKSKFTEDGISTINGFNVPDGNIYDGDATSKVEYTKKNQKNLMNSDDNNKADYEIPQEQI